jgi:deoxyribonuclease V
MVIEPPAAWPATEAQALAEQDRLRPRVRTTGDLPAPRLAADLDVSYAPGGDLLAAAVVVLDVETLEPVEQHTVTGRAAFPYIPGLFAFRELPTLVRALERVACTPDVLVCDGYGIAHPRRFGLASHIGVLTGLPSVGVGKTAFVGTHAQPGPRRGDGADLLDGGEVVGRVLRTRDGVKPVFVSVGHRVDLEAACALVLRLTPAFRLPETTRAADHLSRAALAAADHG